MGDNYVMNDGSSYSIIGHDGKERESFHTYSLSGSENRVDFVDVESIASSISRKDLYSQLISRLANGRKKVEEGAFSKNVKKGGKTIECRTSLSNNDDYDYIGLEITLEGDKSYPQAESVGPDDL